MSSLLLDFEWKKRWMFGKLGDWIDIISTKPVSWLSNRINKKPKALVYLLYQNLCFTCFWQQSVLGTFPDQNERAITKTRGLGCAFQKKSYGQMVIESSFKTVERALFIYDIAKEPDQTSQVGINSIDSMSYFYCFSIWLLSF